jgi:hypothetical protein
LNACQHIEECNIVLIINKFKQVGICIDHNAAFMINKADYSVLYPEGLEGSVMPDGTFSGERLGEIQILDTKHQI